MDNKNKLIYYTNKDLTKIPLLQKLSKEDIFGIYLVSLVFPFRVNSFVIQNLIDPDNLPDDPIFRLTFPHPDMLSENHFSNLHTAVKNKYPKEKLNSLIYEIRKTLNPHPAGQLTSNVPVVNHEPVKGLQHKYRETALIFPTQGQTCHSFCTFCFRWPQFVGMDDLKFATDESLKYQHYIKEHKELTNILITGGDPMVMKARNLEKYISPFLEDGFEHIRFIRIGTKSLTYNPFRYLTDDDSDDILRLFSKISEKGKHLSIMAHFNHHIELHPQPVQNAISRILSTGASIRCQSPILKHINDSVDVWVNMWREQVRQGCIPYYMFVERDTGAHDYFAIPLTKAYKIFRKAFSQVSGLARTVRGPSMSATPGKILIDGITTINQEKVFVLNMIQARNPDWTKKPFFASFDKKATWINQLKPAFGDNDFFYEKELENITRGNISLGASTNPWSSSIIN
ncbi:MAG TPA: lysine 2,3-aminomutase [Ignavibacteriaceae bacterium]|jgi:KamA family protein|nr:lysine 2,3-aminomutase [Ignavibacteriaceae bacterium]HOJ17389.1 lysine 2,3-aminomutase [Ignavibacteriaceae bacterium]